MAIQELDVTLLAVADVIVTSNTNETLSLDSYAQVTLTETISPVLPLSLVAVASVAIDIFIAQQVELSLQSYAQVSLEDEFLGAPEVTLLASAQVLIDVETFGIDDDLELLAFADIMIDAETKTPEATRSSGGTFGAAPPVRIRPDVLPYLTPTPTRRTKFPTQG